MNKSNSSFLRLPLHHSSLLISYTNKKSPHGICVKDCEGLNIRSDSPTFYFRLLTQIPYIYNRYQCQETLAFLVKIKTALTLLAINAVIPRREAKWLLWFNCFKFHFLQSAYKQIYKRFHLIAKWHIGNLLNAFIYTNFL